MNRTSLSCFFILTLFILTGCDKDAGAFTEKLLRVNATGLHLRAEAKRDSKSVELLKNGRLVKQTSDFARAETIGGRAGNWIEVATLAGAKGYVFDAYLQPAEITKAFWETDESNSDSLMDCSAVQGDCASAYTERVYKTLGDKIQKTENGFQVTATGGVVLFENESEGQPDEIKTYRPLIVLPGNNYLLVSVALYEGGYIRMLNLNTGKHLDLWEIPTRPTQSGLMVVSSASIAHNPNGVQIVDISGPEPRLIFQEELPWFPANPRWLSDSKIQFTRYDMAAEGDELKSAGGSGGSPMVRTSATLVRQGAGGTWKFQP